MNPIQLQREGPRLVAAHPNLISHKAQPECRHHKQRHAFTLEADQRYVADLCLDVTCEFKGVSRGLILGPRRFRRHTDPRHIAMTVAYELSGLSTIVLGNLFNRGHEIILWAQNRVNNDKTLRAQADKVVRAVRSELRKK